MVQGSRGIDHGFLPHHYLYQRIETEDIAGDRLLPARIRVLDQSVNWSKFCRPWDVTFGYRKQGIARTAVRDLPPPLPKVLPNKGAKYHDFNPAHDPLPNNYSHCEIRVLKDEVRVTNAKQIGDLAKKEYRTMLSDKYIIIARPHA
ncbi:MAG: hypothetical protein C5B44_05165 [Acidobacteria bacterium]|nr:MAG: hypothetical protein C5B44_05165 [Acidobacteriota bacterium]